MKRPEADNTPLDIKRPQDRAEPQNPVADLGDCDGGVMRVGRAIIIPAILALSVAGSVVTGAEVAVAAVHASAVHPHTTAPSINIYTYHHD